MTTKGNQHIENWENATCECVADGTISATHVSGKCNVSDIFTKEMQDSANFRRLQDLFMCCSSNFLKRVHHIAPDTTPHTPPVLAQSTQHVTSDRPGMLDVLVAYPRMRIPSTLSCISATSHHILSHLAPSSYLQAFMSNPMGGVSGCQWLLQYCKTHSAIAPAFEAPVMRHPEEAKTAICASLAHAWPHRHTTGLQYSRCKNKTHSTGVCR
jgi:hypothetical protein